MNFTIRFSIFLFLMIQVNDAIALNQFEFLFDGKGYISRESWKVNKGDIINVRASGEIIVGMFAGKRTPDGINEYSNNRYNIVKNKPHCGLMVTIINLKSSQIEKKYWNWEFVGSCSSFTAIQSGVLAFDLNESDSWRWDNEPVNGGWKVDFSIIPANSSSLNNSTGVLFGKLKDYPVIKIRENEVLYQCQTIIKDQKNTWVLKNTNGKEVGICTDNPPYVYELVGENSHSNTQDKSIYLDTKQRKNIFYKGRNHKLSQNDKIWYLLNDDGICEGVVRYREDEVFINRELDFFNQLDLNQNSSITSTSMGDLLKHINRNFENREAKGTLTYLCSKTYKLVFNYRYYFDEIGNIWLLNTESESHYHKNPNNENQTALKFTRRDPKNLESTFESIRIPLPTEDRLSQTIIGKLNTYNVSVDGKSYQSTNLMSTKYRGSYNFQSSTYSNTGIIDLSFHALDDIALHDTYSDYIIFKERFGKPSKAETDNFNSVFKISIKNNERTCPWDDPWHK
ncbi:hypothetical protein VB264_15255 [Arcicella aquatica]|uniref:EF-hand domain-containing protein n=1 Tax=Arcicella aquatica TaxID=217141 RepID=A0ABU5QQ01_9BACT|nr:hypothetical protein [Arcicella aquatica]MEA5259153.1 hypothetical protein [Arcicella aquatica]